MEQDRRLAVVSAAQLLTQLAGLRIALRRRLPPDFVLVNRPVAASHLSRNSLVLGTARSAPGLMLGAQAAATVSLLARPGPRARATLGGLGGAMVLGHLVERNSPLWREHREPVSTPLYVLGLAGSIAMAALAFEAGGSSGDVVVTGHASAPPGRVWMLATDLQAAPRTLSGVDAVEVLTAGAFGVGTRWRETRTIAGRSATEEMWVTAVEPGSSYTVEADGPGVHYRSTVELRPSSDGGTDIAMRFGAQPRSRLVGIAAAAIAPLTRRSVARVLQRDLDDLAAAASGHPSAEVRRDGPSSASG